MQSIVAAMESVDAATGQSEDVADADATAQAAAELDIAALKDSLSGLAALQDSESVPSGADDDERWKAAFGTDAAITDIVDMDDVGLGEEAGDVDDEFEVLGTF